MDKTNTSSFNKSSIVGDSNLGESLQDVTDNCPKDNNSSLPQGEESNVVLDEIRKLKELYNSTNALLLEIIHQYNELVDNISKQRQTLDSLCKVALKANEQYDKFKKSFASIIEMSGYGEKLYYAIPLFEDYDSNDEWITKWVNTDRNILNDENINGARVFINKYFYNNTLSLPKDVYCYKPRQSEINNLTPKVKECVFQFYGRVYTFFKLIKDFSDSLRTALLKSLAILKEYQIGEAQKANLPSADQLKLDKDQYISILKNGLTLEDTEISEKYKILALGNNTLTFILDDPNGFTEKARALFRQYQDFQNRLDSFNKFVYSSSLNDIYKLYDIVKISISDFTLVLQNNLDAEKESAECCTDHVNMLKDLLSTITHFLRDAYSIIPLSLEINRNFNEYDVNWYDVLISEDAPSDDLKECISSIIDTGFAKVKTDGTVDFVTKTAKIAVYCKNVINQSSDSDNKA